jgi:primary-amine oxidase
MQASTTLHPRKDHSLHPLDPLTEDEIRRTGHAVRGSAQFEAASESIRFITIELREPVKEEVLTFNGSRQPPRMADVVLLDPSDGMAYEAVVSLDHDTVTSWEQRPGVQPMAVVTELDAAGQMLKRNHEFQEALRRRGITDFDAIQVDAWPAGDFGIEEERGLRLARCVSFVMSEGENHYAHPIDGLVALVDLNRMEVLRVDDHRVVPVPEESGAFTVDAVGSQRQDIAPLEITQPEGPSFTVTGNLVEWQKWRFRVGFTAREGLVLHQLGYVDADKHRPILYRASLSEMVVPYGDPSPTHFFKNAFDAGENGVGIAATSLTRGCDCLGEIFYFDAAVSDAEGRPRKIHNAICMHEEDFGVLWRHIEWRTGEGEIRRSRRLVVSSYSSIGNYDYGFFWYLYQDGTISFEIKLTGVLSTGAVPPGEYPKYGALVAPQLNGMIHQHYFNMRLDLDVDGTDNAVEEVETESAPPGPDNPYLNAFIPKRRRLRSEREAMRSVDPKSARWWEIVNPSKPNRLGQPVGYRLVPGENTRPFAHPEAAVMKRAAFIQHHLWVTPYEPSERFAAGDYPNQHPGGAGLPEWTTADRDLDDQDVVVWYTFGHHHLPRPEDWPVMPSASIGFSLKPVGFFDRNPALDVPPPARHSCGSRRA